MKIEIETDGTNAGTHIKIDGDEVENILELVFSVRAIRKSAPKLQMRQWDEAKQKPYATSIYANDFEKFDGYVEKPVICIGSRLPVNEKKDNSKLSRKENKDGGS